MFLTPVRATAALASALALVGATGQAPAPPTVVAAAHVCRTPAHASGPVPATAVAAARGAVVRGQDTHPITAVQQRAIDARTTRLLAARSAHSMTARMTTVTIPVYVHVMTSASGAGDVSDTAVAKQITVLNQTYSGQDVDQPGTLDTGFRFRLAGTDRYANSTWHTDGQSTTYRARTRRGGPGALNIWVVDFAELGIATFPWDLDSAASVDGIRVLYRSLPGGAATHYNHGETVTHETGHWLGLFHTFQGGCSSVGDDVTDTAAQASPSSGCPTGRNSCTAPGLDPIHNYMDYSYDTCYDEFTPGQSTRMKRMWTAYRA